MSSAGEHSEASGQRSQNAVRGTLLALTALPGSLEILSSEFIERQPGLPGMLLKGNGMGRFELIRRHS
jgi:hypothetical protein